MSIIKVNVKNDYIANILRLCNITTNINDGPWLAGGACLKLLNNDPLDSSDIDLFFRSSDQYNYFNDLLSNLSKSCLDKSAINSNSNDDMITSLLHAISNDKLFESKINEYRKENISTMNQNILAKSSPTDTYKLTNIKLHKIHYGYKSSMTTTYDLTIHDMDSKENIYTKIQLIFKDFHDDYYSLINTFDLSVCKIVYDQASSSLLMDEDVYNDIKNKIIHYNQRSNSDVNSSFARLTKYMALGYSIDNNILYNLMNDKQDFTNCQRY